MDIKPDPGAKVGEAGVTTPWENGNLGKDSDWQARPRKTTSHEDRNENRKNSAGTGNEWDHPWEEECKPAGTLGSMEIVDPER